MLKKKMLIIGIVLVVLIYFLISSTTAIELINEDYNISSTDDKTLHFDYYYNSSVARPILIISDAFSNTSTRLNSRDIAKQFMNNTYGEYFVINIDTRGKGNSTGNHDINVYECRDLVDAIENISGSFSEYVTNYYYIGGLSGSGGRTMTCIGKYPEYYTAAFSYFGISNYTQYYNEDASASKQSLMQDWIGDTPTNNAEGYRSRDGLFVIDNIKTPIILFHDMNDTDVNVTHSRNYNESLSNLDKTVDYRETNISHSYNIVDEHIFNTTIFLNTYTSKPNVDSSGNLTIAGFVETDDFSIWFDDFNRTGSVTYNISGDSYFNLNLTTDTYSGIAQINIKNPDNGTRYDVIDNNIHSKYVYANSDGILDFNITTSNHNLEIKKINSVDFCDVLLYDVEVTS